MRGKNPGNALNYLAFHDEPEIKCGNIKPAFLKVANIRPLILKVTTKNSGVCEYTNNFNALSV